MIKTSRFITMRRTARKLAASMLCFLLPSQILRYILPFLGYYVSPRAKIGFSFIFVDHMHLDHDSRVGHLNVIVSRRVLLRPRAAIGTANIIRGPLSLWLRENASIGNRNVISRARKGVSYGAAVLYLGEGAKVTANHKIDCTASVKFGAFSILAGANSQIWTHGYIHDTKGPGRHRIDGDVCIGNNVYLGSRVIITAGVIVCDAASVGAGANVTKHLTQPGFYVSGPLRIRSKSKDPMSRTDLERVLSPDLVETVYKKLNARP